jgi:hypothetical protein
LQPKRRRDSTSKEGVIVESAVPVFVVHSKVPFQRERFKHRNFVHRRVGYEIGAEMYNKNITRTTGDVHTHKIQVQYIDKVVQECAKGSGTKPSKMSLPYCGVSREFFFLPIFLAGSRCARSRFV